MSALFFAETLSTVAHFWRIYRRDGVALGFVTHDRDLTFGGIHHRSAPGLTPSAIRLTSDAADEEAAIEGALSHTAIREDELAAGRFDGAEIELGIVDWETGRAHTLYVGTVAEVTREGARFQAELVSRKAELARDTIPRTGPSCRASFCGPGCDLNPRRFETRARIVGLDRDANRLALSPAADTRHEGGTLRFLSGPRAGDSARILAISPSGVTIDGPLPADDGAGFVMLREGCDHTIATCAGRFANAANFRGEPHLPGNDLLSQYPVAR